MSAAGALAGRRVVITRPAGQEHDFADALRALGAEPLLFPLVRIEPPANPTPLRRAVREAAHYDWIVFTSVNGVERFFAELVAAGMGVAALERARLACIGPATAAALGRWGRQADVVPGAYVAEAVLEELARTGSLAGARVLLPRAAQARAVLPRGLAELGATVDVVEAYRAVAESHRAAELRALLEAGSADALTFTASSTVRSFAAHVGCDVVANTLVAVIGPVTAETARECGLNVDIVAAEHDIAGLVRALCEHVPERATPRGVS